MASGPVTPVLSLKFTWFLGPAGLTKWQERKSQLAASRNGLVALEEDPQEVVNLTSELLLCPLL